MPLLHPQEVLGFHSCDRDLGLRLLTGTDELRPSSNVWDWLGNGIYFWEQNPSRALIYAEEAANGLQTFSGRIQTPFVVGAIIELGNCLNLTESGSIKIVKNAYKDLLQVAEIGGDPLPVNRGANRRLDCAVINYANASQYREKGFAYDTIRCAFPEGDPIYEGANFTERHHIEICVVNPKCIKGYFLPRPVRPFNPYLRRA